MGSALRLQRCWKDTPRQVFFDDCCEIFKKNYFEKHQRTAASETHLVNTKLFIKILLCKNMLSAKFSVFHKNSFKKKKRRIVKKKR